MMDEARAAHEVKLPPMPRTREDLSFACPLKASVGRRKGSAIHTAPADWHTLVRTEVKDRNDSSVDIKYADIEGTGTDDPAITRGQLGGGHDRPPLAASATERLGRGHS
jgi:hypothetical protein